VQSQRKYGCPSSVYILKSVHDISHEKLVRMTVTDNGPGFSPRILSRAFEPYVTSKSKGTGLGLAVVKKIVDEHEARIELKNRIRDGHIVGARISILFQKLAPIK
jgi:nitrogen fixation/metabolism regulation signal transduction histidine kinase